MDADAFCAAYRQLIADTQARLPQTRILLMEPFLLPIPEDRRAWRPFIDRLIQIVREMAVANTLPLVPLEGLLFAQAASVGLAAVAHDGVHPTPFGHEVIAQSWLQTFRGLQ